MDFKYYVIILTILGAVSIAIILTMANHDIDIITDNYRTGVHDDMVNYYSCDNYKDSFYYEKYLQSKDLYMKSMTDNVVIDEVKQKITQCQNEANP